MLFTSNIATGVRPPSVRSLFEHLFANQVSVIKDILKAAALAGDKKDDSHFVTFMDFVDDAGGTVLSHQGTFRRKISTDELKTPLDLAEVIGAFKKIRNKANKLRLMQPLAEFPGCGDDRLEYVPNFARLYMVEPIQTRRDMTALAKLMIRSVAFNGIEPVVILSIYGDTYRDSDIAAKIAILALSKSDIVILNHVFTIPMSPTQSLKDYVTSQIASLDAVGFFDPERDRHMRRLGMVKEFHLMATGVKDAELALREGVAKDVIDIDVAIQKNAELLPNHGLDDLKPLFGGELLMEGVTDTQEQPEEHCSSPQADFNIQDSTLRTMFHFEFPAGTPEANLSGAHFMEALTRQDARIAHAQIAPGASFDNAVAITKECAGKTYRALVTTLKAIEDEPAIRRMLLEAISIAEQKDNQAKRDSTEIPST